MMNYPILHISYVRKRQREDIVIEKTVRLKSLDVDKLAIIIAGEVDRNVEKAIATLVINKKLSYKIIADDFNYSFYIEKNGESKEYYVVDHSRMTKPSFKNFVREGLTQGFLKKQNEIRRNI